MQVGDDGRDRVLPFEADRQNTMPATTVASRARAPSRASSEPTCGPTSSARELHRLVARAGVRQAGRVNVSPLVVDELL